MDLAAVVASRHLVVDGEIWTVTVGRPQLFDGVGPDWFVPVALADAGGAEVWSSRAGGIDSLQALTLALLVLSEHLARERDAGRLITFAGGSELGLPVLLPDHGSGELQALLRLGGGPATAPPRDSGLGSQRGSGTVGCNTDSTNASRRRCSNS